jgi:hypothetical protein
MKKHTRRAIVVAQLVAASIGATSLLSEAGARYVRDISHGALHDGPILPPNVRRDRPAGGQPAVDIRLT